MARLAVFASGRGSNFVAIAQCMRRQNRHCLEFMLCDRKAAAAFDRARELGIPSYYVTYVNRTREAAEAEMLVHLARHAVDVVALAGYMRLFTPYFVKGFHGEILNLHPALLPKYPGAHGIEESYASGDRELGISVIRVDEGCDTGKIVMQKSFTRSGTESIAEIETRIHAMEHEWFPRAVMDALDEADARRTAP
jgi:phosphoribosylglycinamide formyltransferase-1